MKCKFLIAILLFVFSSTCSATIVMAGWTGNSSAVKSSGNLVLLNCEYTFLTKRFWRTFENVCEPMIFLDYEKEVMK